MTFYLIGIVALLIVLTGLELSVERFHTSARYTRLGMYAVCLFFIVFLVYLYGI